MRMGRATHRDIARLVRVNQSTVSRALRNDPIIPEATRQRIAQAAESLGYRPDPVLSEVAALRWREGQRRLDSVLAVVIQNPLPGQLIGDNENMLVGIKSRARQIGYQVERHDFEDPADTGKIVRRLNAKGVRGLLWLPFFHQPWPNDFPWRKFINLAVGCGLWRPPVNTLRSDAFAAVTLAWERMVELGYRRIGAVLYRHPQVMIDDEQRLAAVWRCQHLAFPGLPAIPTAFYDSETPGAEIGRWLCDNHVEAVVGFSGEVEWKLKLTGLQAGRDYALANLHLAPDEPGLAGIQRVAIRQGEMAVEYLHRALLTNDFGVPPNRLDLLIEPAWVDGPSAPPAEGLSSRPA